MKLRIVYFTFSFLVLGCILKAHAHEIRPAFLQIIQVDSTTYNAYWKIPRLGEAVPKIYVVFPDEFKVESLKQPMGLGMAKSL